MTLYYGYRSLRGKQREIIERYASLVDDEYKKDVDKKDNDKSDNDKKDGDKE
jgi:hypothetical protein